MSRKTKNHEPYFASIFPEEHENREFAGNLVPRGFWEREPNTLQWKP